LAVGVQPSKFMARIQQAFPELFPVCALPIYLHVLLDFCTFVQGVLPPLLTLQISRQTGASKAVDQLMP
jgi:hypothetical protein